MEISNFDGKIVESVCEWFADENMPQSFIAGNCVDGVTGRPKCKLYRECFLVYTRRGEAE